MLEENKYRLERLHTHEFALDDAEEALQTLGRERNPGERPICVSLHPALAPPPAGG